MDEVDAFAMMGAGDGSRERVPGLLEVARIGRGYGEAQAYPE
jgi:hypothetical protein